MKCGVVFLALLLVPMSARLTPAAGASPVLAAASIGIETIAKSDDDEVSLEVGVQAPADHLVATKQKVAGVWYQDSSFEVILGVLPHAPKSDFMAGAVTLSPSRPLSQAWTFHCVVSLFFSDHSVVRIGWLDVTLTAGARAVTRTWTAADCLPEEAPAPAAHPGCTLQMTFKGD
jgi:hypothetical protein